MAEADGPFHYRTGAPLHVVPTLDQIEGETVTERLRSAVAAINGRIVFTNSFGIEGQLLAHHIFTEKLPIEVVTLDTGRLFPETYKLWQETEERYGVRIRPIYPEAKAVSAVVADQGINGFYYSEEARQSCCDVRKVQPLNEALDGASAWLTGLRPVAPPLLDQARQLGFEAQSDQVRTVVRLDSRRDRRRVREARHSG